MQTPAVKEILAQVSDLATDVELQDVIHGAVTIRQERLQAHRRKVWKAQDQRPARESVDSARERT